MMPTGGVMALNNYLMLKFSRLLAFLLIFFIISLFISFLIHSFFKHLAGADLSDLAGNNQHCYQSQQADSDGGEYYQTGRDIKIAV